MRAFVFDKYKHPVHEAEVPEPVVGEHDVLVRVAAAGLNQLDEKIREGEFKQILPYRTPVILGHDVAGTVIRTGAKVTGFKAGDQVYARPRDHRIGTFAERIAIDEADLAPAPATISPEEAASLPLVALTAWQALVEKGRVTAGQRVLIHAGTGGVGTIAIRLAKHLGAHVATTVSGANADFARELGADVVIDYRTQDFEQELSGYDFVLDSLGGESLTKSLRVLRPGGIVVGIAGPPTREFAREMGLNAVLRLATAALSRKVRQQAASLGVSYEFLFMKASGEQLRRIASLVDNGVIRPVVGRTFPFDQLPQALASLSTGRARGKTVILGATDDPGVASYAKASTTTITTGGKTFAYRDLGPREEIPVIFFGHLAATLDNWDPRIVDAIAATRQVITFDQQGVGASDGTVPDTIEEAADDAYAFIRGLGYDTIDVFSFSMGGMIAQDLVVKHPELVRKLVLTGTGPRGGKGIDKVVGTTYGDLIRAAITRSDPKEFLFFNRDQVGKRAGKEFIGRLGERGTDRDRPISTRAFRTQLKAIQRYGRAAASDLSVITQPTLIANGDNDRMVPSVLSQELHRRIAGSELIIYPNSGHGGIFQHWEEFAPIAAEFLAP